jgi:ubiquinone/menaquinone biosynthesis C-methylase UbiE
MTEQLSDVTSDSVGEFYDEVAGLVEIFGGNLHNGYWYDDGDTTPWLEATNRLADIVTGKLEARPGQHVLDVGCGVGVPAVRLAQRTDAQVTGITVSGWQVGEATRRANSSGLRGQVRFEYGNAESLSYPAAEFDAVLAFDSLPHATDRGLWLREMARVLRPGGRFVITEFTEETPLTAGDVEVLKFGEMAKPLTSSGVLDVITAAGFVVDEFVNCGDKIRRTFTEYFEHVARRRQVLATAHGKEKVAMYEHGMRPLFDICRTKMGYIVVAGHKP